MTHYYKHSNGNMFTNEDEIDLVTTKKHGVKLEKISKKVYEEHQKKAAENRDKTSSEANQLATPSMVLSRLMSDVRYQGSRGKAIAMIEQYQDNSLSVSDLVEKIINQE